MTWLLIQADIPSLFFAPYRLYFQPTVSIQFNSFFNTLWLIMNDMTLGIAFGAFLLENNQVLAELANHTIQVPSLLTPLDSTKK
jgi:hypothetical protein